jgi:hypothetical protein
LLQQNVTTCDGQSHFSHSASICLRRKLHDDTRSENSARNLADASEHFDGEHDGSDAESYVACAKSEKGGAGRSRRKE